MFYIATAAAIVTFVAWSVTGDTEQAVTSAVTVLVIACPHALGLAIPLVIALSTAVAARNGILIKDRLALERMRTVTAVLFDKTGTLTEGRHVVTGVAGVGIADEEVLRLAGGVELDSEHPLARAIVAAAREHGDVARASEFQAITGRGVEAVVDGQRYAVGGPVLLRERFVDRSGRDPRRRRRVGRSRALRCCTWSRRRDHRAFTLEDRIHPKHTTPSLSCIGWGSNGW